MSEAKWWPIGTLPAEPGWYQSEGYGVRVSWQFPRDNDLVGRVDHAIKRQFYGPIPDPPEPPPRLRRFTANCKVGGVVSGICVVGSDTYYVTYFHQGALCRGERMAKELADIHWIDGE